MAGWSRTDIELSTGETVVAQAPVIVSASRSTDIPAFYAGWFVGRLRAGYVKWFNPFNGLPLYVGFHKMRLVVFWSKNPAPMLAYLDELDCICPNYYFQFTLNDYDEEQIEPRVPKIDDRVATFKALSERLGRDRVVWRFDPLILTDALTVPKLLEKIERLGDKIAPLTSRLVFSFVDIGAYKKVAANMERGGVKAREFTPDEMEEMAAGIGKLVKGWGITAGTCGEIKDLDKYGIEHNRCVDDRLIMKCFNQDRALMEFIGARYVEPDMFTNPLGGWVLDGHRKDSGQRKACGCIMSKDIGEYNTCPHLCHYCYANTSNATAMANWNQHLACPHAETITGR